MTPHRLPPAAALIVLLAAASAPSVADTPPANDGMRFVSVGVQADDRHDLLALTTLSLPVGERAWVQASGGRSRDMGVDGPRRPGILGLSVGAAGQQWQVTLGATRRDDASRLRQTDWASSIDWHRDGNVLGLDLTHRQSQAAGSVTVGGALGGTTTVPAQARLAGGGVGLHGTLALGEHASVYAAVASNHYRSSTPQATTPALAQALFGGASVVNRDEAALDRSALVGATWRMSRAAVSAEYATGRVHDGAGTLRSVALKAAIDVAPGWRVMPGVGRGTADQGGKATFASLAVTRAW